MIDMKCPFCQQKLDSDSQSWEYGCSNPDCETAGTMCGTKELWQELIRTRKALEMALKELKQLKYGGKADRTYLKNKAGKALEQIKELDNAETHV